jgi:plastocyanin
MKLGTLLFFIPIILIGGIVIYAYASLIIPQPRFGTIILKAQVSIKDSQQKEIHVYASIAGETYLTPANVSMPPGKYSISFQQVDGLKSPEGCNIDVVAGKTLYCVGEYTPIQAVVNVYSNYFEPSKVYAYSNITPVVWVNKNQNYTVLIIQPLGRIVIPPNQNFTYTYNDAGTYGFYYLFSTGHGEVVVKNFP